MKPQLGLKKVEILFCDTLYGTQLFNLLTERPGKPKQDLSQQKNTAISMTPLLNKYPPSDISFGQGILEEHELAFGRILQRYFRSLRIPEGKFMWQKEKLISKTKLEIVSNHADSVLELIASLPISPEKIKKWNKLLARSQDLSEFIQSTYQKTVQEIYKELLLIVTLFLFEGYLLQFRETDQLFLEELLTQTLDNHFDCFILGNHLSTLNFRSNPELVKEQEVLPKLRKLVHEFLFTVILVYNGFYVNPLCSHGDKEAKKVEASIQTLMIKDDQDEDNIYGFKKIKKSD